MQKGSVTVFFSLILLLLCSLFFSMVETTRILALENQADTVTHKAMGSFLSEYNQDLYEKYHILGVDTTYGGAYEGTSYVSERILTFCDLNSFLADEDNGTNFLQLTPTSAGIKEIRLLTDENGRAFEQQAVAVAKRLATEEAVSELLQGSSYASEVLSDETSTEDKLEAAEDAMEHPENYPMEEGEELTEVAEIEVTEENNPLTIGANLIEKGWLYFVTDGADISEKAMSTEAVVSKRELAEGTAKTDLGSLSVTDLAFYLWYLEDCFGSFANQKESAALSYGLEYIVAGKESDKDNLESVINRILAIREVANLATIMSDSTMMAESYQVALAIAAITANPAIVQVVQVAVIAVWALVESILDLRTLLSGGKVAAIKTRASWTSSVSNLGGALSGGVKAKESSYGISYTQYLCGMVLLLNEEQKGLRPLDLIESTLALSEDATGVQMDQIACEVTADVVFEAEPMFLFMVENVDVKGDWYQYCIEEAVSY